MPAESVIRVLRFIESHPDCGAGEVARVAWPDHPMLGKPAGGNGGTGGNAGAVVAAGMCGRMRKRGWITGYSTSYRITAEGRKIMKGK